MECSVCGVYVGICQCRCCSHIDSSRVQTATKEDVIESKPKRIDSTDKRETMFFVGQFSCITCFMSAICQQQPAVRASEQLLRAT